MCAAPSCVALVGQLLEHARAQDDSDRPVRVADVEEIAVDARYGAGAPGHRADRFAARFQ
jgi:hypothetical protein